MKLTNNSSLRALAKQSSVGFSIENRSGLLPLRYALGRKDDNFKLVFKNDQSPDLKVRFSMALINGY